MKFENLLSEINGFGKFQIVLVLLLLSSRLSVPFHYLLSNFIAAVPDHHCNLTSLDDDAVFRSLTAQQKVAVGIPVEQHGSPSSCRMYVQPKYQNYSGNSSSEEDSTVQCQNGWVYDNSTLKSTLATEWDLVCSRKGMNNVIVSIFFFGVMVGVPFLGFFSDRFGRRPILLVSYVSTIVFAALSAFSPSYKMFVVTRFFTGMSLGGIELICVALNVEWSSIKHRTLLVIIVGVNWTLGTCFLVGAAYFIMDWRTLVLTATSPLIISVICWRWVPESARWLLVKERAKTGHHYIMKCAEMNNRTDRVANITVTALLESVESKTAEKTYSFVDLFRTAKIRKLSLCTGIIWFGISFTYYGISLNITGFGLNLYLTQFIFAAIEIPVMISMYFLLNKLGRRSCQAGSLLLTGLCIFVNMFVTKEQWITRTTFAVLGKAFSEASFTVMILYTAELFPTVVRQNGQGYSGSMARLGSSMSPLVMLLEDVWHLLPWVIYCAVAIGCGLLCALLPETLNRQLPDVIEDLDKPRHRRNKDLQ